MAALIKRYGTTPTGIGRIIIQMDRSRVWREPTASPDADVSSQTRFSSAC